MKRIVVISLILITLLCACGAQSANDEFFGVGSVAWGESGESLFKEHGLIEVIDYDEEFCGHTAHLHYTFNEDSGLIAAYYLFIQENGKEWTELYTELLAELTELYGEPQTMMTTDDNGATVPAPTIEDVIANGEGSCSDTWTDIPGPEELNVSAVLRLNANGQLALSFYAR